jgi:hypothetical protein
VRGFKLVAKSATELRKSRLGCDHSFGLKTTGFFCQGSLANNGRCHRG